MQNETVWLTLDPMAELFQRNKSTISRHVKNIFECGELDENVVVAFFATTTRHGAIANKVQTHNVAFYNLDMIISVGYRVNSYRGVQFRMWATNVLKEYLIKGFAMNDELLKRAGINVNVVSDEQAEEVFNENNGEQTEFSIQSINDKFNKELQQQIDGTLPENHVYSLGMPSNVLLSAGLQNLPIELRSRKLEEKSKQENHVFKISDVNNLPNSIQSPIAVFDSSTMYGRKVILTELKHKGENFVVVISTQNNSNSIQINDIRSLYPKGNSKLIYWIMSGENIRYINKNKAIDWIGKQRSNSAEVANTLNDLEIAAKVIQNFENPPINGEKISTNAEKLSTSGGLIYGYTQNGEIYLTERGLNPNTPVHEYTHLWAAAMMKKTDSCFFINFDAI